jgi:hypothetical protein
MDKLESIVDPQDSYDATERNDRIFERPESVGEREEGSQRAILSTKQLLRNPATRFKNTLAMYVEQFTNPELKCTLKLWQEGIMMANLEISKLVRAEVDALPEKFKEDYESVFYRFLNTARNSLDIPILWPVIYIEAGSEVKNLPDELYQNRIADTKDRVA